MDELICDSFNDVFSSSGYITASNDRLIKKVKSIWKEAAVVEFKVLNRHLIGGTAKDQENYLDNQSSGRDLKPEAPDCEA
jgi:hypothetical protein